MRWILVAVCMMIVGCGNSPTGPYEVEQATPNTHGVFVQNDDDSHPVVLPLTAERDSTWTERPNLCFRVAQADTTIYPCGQ